MRSAEGSTPAPGQAPEAVTRAVARARAAPGTTVLRPRPWSPRGGQPEHVWYVSYGSNLLRRRFERYLLGGTLPHLGVVYPTGPATAPASGDRAVVLPGRLLFACDAPAWGGGGVCFWDAGAGTDGGTGDGSEAAGDAWPGVLARAWRVTLQQYLEVVHLENVRDPTPQRRAVPWDPAVFQAGAAVVDEGWYGRVVVAGELDGEPALTFTAPAPGRLPRRPPSVRYRDVVVAGLVETFGDPDRGELDAGAADGYVEGAVESSVAGGADGT